MHARMHTCKQQISLHSPTRVMMARTQFHLPPDTGDPGVRNHSLVDLRWRRRCSIEPWESTKSLGFDQAWD